MLFVTNRRIAGSRQSEAGRRIAFVEGDDEPGASLYFCERQGPGSYVELTAVPFFARLRRGSRQQVLFLVHGFNCQPEQRIFPDAERLQDLCDALAPGLVEVVPLVWPCGDDPGLVLDYWDDQRAADASGLALARILGKFIAWRDRLGAEDACLKHVNLLAHSMGNRVLATALSSWAQDYSTVPALFRSVLMVAADVPNDLFAAGQPGAVIAGAARHVVVYHAADDLALRSSKVVNVRHKVVRRRLGHTGPVDLDGAPRNVVAVDCDGFNSRYDRFGHSYFLADPDGRPGALLRHLVETLRTGRVAGLAPGGRCLLLEPGSSQALPPPANEDRRPHDPSARSGLAESA
jgi:esterase/lipase superfamily enzyme